MRILAISGSLRAASSNTVLLKALASLAPTGTEIILFSGLGDLPHFNPDLDGEDAPPAVADFRSQMQASKGVLISSPEYAHGVPGVLKNALDWVVGSGEFVYKPVALISGSARSIYVQAALIETLTVMMARMVPEASVTLQLTGNKIDEAGVLANPDFTEKLSFGLTAFIGAIHAAEMETGMPLAE